MVPAPGGLPVVGHLAAFHRDRLGFLDACRATGGPVVRLRLFGSERSFDLQASDHWVMGASAECSIQLDDPSGFESFPAGPGEHDLAVRARITSTGRRALVSVAAAFSKITITVEPESVSWCSSSRAV